MNGRTGGKNIFKYQSGWRIFRWPLLLNCVCLLGLISALLGDGWMDWLSWLCLGSSLVLMMYAWVANTDKDSKGSS